MWNYSMIGDTFFLFFFFRISNDIYDEDDRTFSFRIIYGPIWQIAATKYRIILLFLFCGI